MLYHVCLHALLESALSFLSFGSTYLTNQNITCECHHYFNTYIPIFCLSTILSNNLTGSAIYASVSMIAEFHVCVDLPAPVPPVHTATFHRTNLSMSRCIAGVNILARLRAGAAMEPQLVIEEPDVRNTPLSSDMYAA